MDEGNCLFSSLHRLCWKNGSSSSGGSEQERDGSFDRRVPIYEPMTKEEAFRVGPQVQLRGIHQPWASRTSHVFLPKWGFFLTTTLLSVGAVKSRPWRNSIPTFSFRPHALSISGPVPLPETEEEEEEVVIIKM